VARGGPDGGDGGRGGDVWLVASRNHSSLIGFANHPHRRAGDGTHGQGGRRAGRSGQDCIAEVPEGTVVHSLDGRPVADLAVAGDRFLAARGGIGGRGNASFLSNRRRAPGFAEQGEVGEEIWYDLELKLLADVALVGFPNAGKSTLISKISAARPKIADYPFTTLEPHLGVVRLARWLGPSRAEALSDLVVADVPGLVEGAASGRGLGLAFLRHVERARVLCILLDPAPEAGCEPSEQYRILLAELGRYKPSLLERPRVLAWSKVDMWPLSGGAGSGELPGGTGDAYGGQVPLPISGVTGAGLRELLGLLEALVRSERAGEVKVLREPVVHRPLPEEMAVHRDPSGIWVVEGRAPERAVRLSDMNDAQAMAYASRRLASLGVERMLRRAGARRGDTIRIGAMELTYEPDDVTEDARH